MWREASHTAILPEDWWLTDNRGRGEGASHSAGMCWAVWVQIRQTIGISGRLCGHASATSLGLVLIAFVVG